MPTMMMSIRPPLALGRNQEIELMARGIQADSPAGYKRTTFYNPRRVAGTVPESAGNVGPNYNERVAALDPARRYDYFGGFPVSSQNPSRSGGAALHPAAMRTMGAPERTELMPPRSGMVSAAVMGARERWDRGETRRKLQTQGAAGVSFGGSFVDQALQGQRGRAPELPPMRQDGTAGQTTGWGGTMRPISLGSGENLLERRPALTGREGDSALAARAAEFDLNLADYMRSGRAAWQTRAEYERAVAGLPGAGEEILPHVQRRAAENMTFNQALDWERARSARVAEEQARREWGASAARERVMAEQVGPDQMAAVREDYMQLPTGGWRRRPVDKLEQSEDALSRFEATASPAELEEFRKSYIRTPTGWARRSPAPAGPGTMQQQMEMIRAIASGRNPGMSGRQKNEFTTEQEALSANLPTGTVIYINGRPAVVE